MLKKIALGSAAAIVLLVAAAAGGWWFFIREDDKLATEPPEIPAGLAQATATTAASGGTATAASGVSTGDRMVFEVVAESSEAAYFADEELARLGVPSKAKGATKDITGTFYLSADGWELDPDRTSSFTVDLTTLKSDEDRRDNRVQQALETSTYPRATFTVTGISGVDPTLAQAAEQTLQLTGILDLHGVQKEVTWEVEARREGNVITALATVRFNFADFGITPPNISGFVSVQDEVTLQMQIIARAA